MPSLTQLSGKNDSDNDQESSIAADGNLTNRIPGFCFQDSQDQNEFDLLNCPLLTNYQQFNKTWPLLWKNVKQFKKAQ